MPFGLVIAVLIFMGMFMVGKHDLFRRSSGLVKGFVFAGFGIALAAVLFVTILPLMR